MRPHVATIDRIVQSSIAARTLSAKFSFVVDGGGIASLRSVGHDIGLFATRMSTGEPVFKIGLADTTTNRAVRPEVVGQFITFALELIANTGATRCRDIVANHDPDVMADAVGSASQIPLETCCASHDDRQTHIKFGYQSGSAAKSSWVAAGVPLARLDADQIAQLADVCERCEGTLRLTPWQSIVVPGATRDDACALAALGFDIEDRDVQIVACAGATGCERTNAPTKADAARLRNELKNLPSRTTGKPWSIHLSGCPRGCAMSGTSDILALALPESANYALHAGSRPSTARASIPHRAEVDSLELTSAIHDMINPTG